DAAKGVEAQTRKLFQVCRMRNTPIVTFINKLDRPGRDPFELMSEIEKLLGIHCVPVSWPIGMGPTFRGVYDRIDRKVHLFVRGTDHGESMAAARDLAADDPELGALLGDELWHTLRDEVALIDEAGEGFDPGAFHRGEITPVFFGS